MDWEKRVGGSTPGKADRGSSHLQKASVQSREVIVHRPVLGTVGLSSSLAATV